MSKNKFEKRHYEAVAKVLHQTQPPDESPCYEQWDLIVQRLADLLGADNPRFRRDRFWMACRGVSVAIKKEAA